MDHLAATAKDFIAEIQNQELPANLEGDVSQALEQKGLPHGDDVKWTAYRVLMSHRYWTRAWTLAEVRRSFAATVVWGAVEIPWLQVVHAAVWGFKSPDLHGVPSALDTGFVAPWDCEVVAMHAIPSPPERSLYFTLHHFFDKQCSDKRDKIFAALSLVPEEERVRFPISYSSSELEVYRQAAIHIIVEEGSVDILEYATFQGSGSHAGSQPWPSWVPRWDGKLNSVPPIAVQNYLPCGGIRFWWDDWVSVNETQDILSVTGVQVGAITVQAPMDPKLHPLQSHVSVLEYFEDLWEMAQKYANPTIEEEPLALQFLWTILTGEADDVIDEFQIEARKELAWDFVDYFTSAAVFHGAPEKLKTPLLISLLLALLNHLREPYNAALPRHRQLFNEWLVACCVEGFDPEFIKECQTELQEVGVEQQRINQLVDIYASLAQTQHKCHDSWTRRRNFFHAYQKTGLHQRFFVTENGHMGMGPPGAKLGDVVVVLFGGSVPFLLRPEGEGKYLVIGSCYCYGVMHGEFVGRVEREGRLEDEKMVFRLV